MGRGRENTIVPETLDKTVTAIRGNRLASLNIHFVCISWTYFSVLKMDTNYSLEEKQPQVNQEIFTTFDPPVSSVHIWDHQLH